MVIAMLMMDDNSCDDEDNDDLILADSITRVEEGVEGGLDILQEVGKHRDDDSVGDDNH